VSDTSGQIARLSGCLGKVTARLDAIGARWTIAGALAALEYRSTARLTTDVDLLAEWHDQLIPALEQAGLSLRVHRDQSQVHLIRGQGPGCTLDVIVAGTEYQRGAIRRGLRKWLTIEDVLVHKLIAWRPKDRDDVRSILSARPVLDEAYIERWVREWEVEDRWERARGWL
jgi:hypothetical protein